MESTTDTNFLFGKSPRQPSLVFQSYHNDFSLKTLNATFVTGHKKLLNISSSTAPLSRLFGQTLHISQEPYILEPSTYKKGLKL